MKRACSLLLTALLLAGCTAAPAASESAASTATAETPAAEEAAPTASTEPLHLLQQGDEKQYYLTESANADQTLVRFRIVDLTTGENTIPCDVEGCTHDNED